MIYTTNGCRAFGYSGVNSGGPDIKVATKAVTVPVSKTNIHPNNIKHSAIQDVSSIKTVSEISLSVTERQTDDLSCHPSSHHLEN